MSNQVKALIAVVLVAVVGGGAYYQFVYSKEQVATPDPNAAIDLGTGAASDCPTTGTDPNAATVPPPAATDPAAAGAVTTPPPAAAVGAAGSDVTVTAGFDWDWSETSDGVIRADAQTDPITGQPVDPAATAAIDPATGQPIDPAAAGGGIDPCADAAPTGVGGLEGTTSAIEGDRGAGGRAAKVDSKLVAEGTQTGNNADALKVSNLVAGIAQKNQLNFSVQTTLLPVTGGLTAIKPKQLKAYRANVTAAVLRIKVADEGSMQQWTTSRKKTRIANVRAFLKLLKTLYPDAQRSVSIVSSSDSLLAIGDAGAKGAPTTRVLG